MKEIFSKSNYFALVFYATFLITLIIATSELLNSTISSGILILISIQSIFSAIAIIKGIKLNKGDHHE